MSTLSARNLRESLKKAQNVGILEEPFTLFEDLELVVRNLRPDEYEAITAEVKELDGLEYLYAFQLGHVNRAIVEINGQNLRDVQFVEDEEDDPKHPGQTKTVKLELHAWLYKNMVSTWSKEAVYVVYRKVEDAVERAEGKAKKGITFVTPEETDEDRYRRLVGEIKDLEDNLPAKLVEHILDDNGLMRKSTADEVKRAMDQATKFAQEEEAKKKAGGGGSPPQSPPMAAAPPAAPPPPPPPAPPMAATPQGPDPEALMRARQPMNQASVDVPQPLIVSPTPRYNNVPAGRPPQPSPPTHPPLAEAIPGPQPVGSAAKRGAANAALESDADTAGALVGGGAVMPARPTNIPILEKKQVPIDPRAAASIIDPKPKGGINPHFRSHNRGPV